MADVAVAERTLPHNLEAERSVLGAILLHNDAFNLAAEVIDSRDFFRDAHRRIFDKMVTLVERGDPIDLVTLKEELGRSAELEEVGGPAYIAALVDGVPRSTNVEHYARIVKEKSTLRNLIYAANKILTNAYEADQESDLILDEAESAITILNVRNENPERQSIRQFWERALLYDHFAVGGIEAFDTPIDDADNTALVKFLLEVFLRMSETRLVEPPRIVEQPLKMVRSLGV